jgi:hypothetical protein
MYSYPIIIYSRNFLPVEGWSCVFKDNPTYDTELPVGIISRAGIVIYSVGSEVIYSIVDIKPAYLERNRFSSFIPVKGKFVIVSFGYRSKVD